MGVRDALAAILPHGDTIGNASQSCLLSWGSWQLWDCVVPPVQVTFPFQLMALHSYQGALVFAAAKRGGNLPLGFGAFGCFANHKPLNRLLSFYEWPYLICM